MDINKQSATIAVAIVLLVSVLSVGIVYSAGSSENDFDTSVLVYNRDTSNDLRNEDISLNIIEEYDGFTLVETSRDNIESLENNGYTVESMENRDYVGLQGYSFNTDDGAPDISDSLEITSYPNDGQGYYILQFIGPIRPE